MNGNKSASGERLDPDDAPDLSSVDLAQAVWTVRGKAVPAAEGMAAMKAAAARGRPKLAITKVPVTTRLDPDIVDAFKRTGTGWQTRMNDALRQYLEEHPLA
jgi:uncharacterized protein (DUF4415 family)